jgi:hypothetical protein
MIGIEVAIVFYSIVVSVSVIAVSVLAFVVSLVAVVVLLTPKNVNRLSQQGD